MVSRFPKKTSKQSILPFKKEKQISKEEETFIKCNATDFCGLIALFCCSICGENRCVKHTSQKCAESGCSDPWKCKKKNYIEKEDVIIVGFVNFLESHQTLNVLI